MSGPNATNLPRPVMERFSSSDRTNESPSLEVSNLSQRAIIAAYLETAKRRIQTSANLGFHLRMVYAVATLVIISYAGCRLTSIHTDISGRVIAIVAMFAMVSPLPIYWHEKGRIAMRESSLVVPWELLLAALLSFPVLIAARLRMPLQDTLFGGVDQSLGIYVPSIEVGADHHWLGALLNRSYPWLLPLLAAAAFVPALMGKMKHAREFLVANLVAFAIGLPLFALLPAVGPWYCYHLAPNPAQAACWAQFLALRVPGPYIFQEQAAGVVCFPSFHVIWAILCASALWGFRSIRIPVALLSLMIIASTLTTGWHYFSDVLGGVVIAALSMAIAKVYAA
jgi:membrane-associated phospholipid phosphatase